MRHETRFLISRKPFAVDLSSLQTRPYKIWPTDTHERYDTYITAVWFRRRSGLTYACVGALSNATDAPPASAREFLEGHTDGRGGGDCHGRWDGARYWGAQEPEVMAAHMEILRPMLDNYPAVPDGFDGWWTFQRP